MSGGGGPSHHETFYETYINHGNHASGGGIINVHHQTTNYLNVSNPLEELENQRVALDYSVPREPFDGSRRAKRRLTDSGSSGDLSRPKKQRFGDFVQISIDIAKQSADFCTPLEAALAGVGALVEHYDSEEFEGVKGRIEGLLPQLNRLKQNITTTSINGDDEETRRQMELISALENIAKQSREFLAKGMTTRGADRGTEVVGLVEQFREVIVHYQISQQQAIYNRIAYLTSSFSTLLTQQEKSPAVKNKLDSVMERLDGLCSAEDGDDTNGSLAKLSNTLRLIGDSGNKLYNRINAQGYHEFDDETQAVSSFAEDTLDALLDYQITKQNAMYDQNCKTITTVDLAVLNNCRRARGAAYQHGHRRGCLRGTREVILNDIESWTKDFNKSPVFWLNGLAGTGKSTIAQTVAEHAYADGLLGASFFCSRDFEDRSDLHFIFPTLAFQLAHKFPSFLASLISLLQTNPDVVDESLYTQMERLIVEPLRSAEVSTLIVIDALDECKDDEPSSAILSVLGRLVEQIPRVKFFITGRPEPRIKTGFRLPLLEDATKVFVLHDVHPDLINNDIQLFLKHELSELAARRRLEGWPSDEHISLLCQRAAGLFVYAVATIKFLDSRTHLPDKRLDAIVNLPQCTIPEGKTQFRPKTTLDSLYMSVLQMAFSEEDPEVDSKVRSIIGAVVLLVNPLPPSGIAELTQLDPREVVLLLTSVQSLLILDEDPTQPVKSFHKSFPDFVADPSRCNDTRFYITPEILHLELAINCLVVLNNGLEHNLLNLPDYALNSEVKDLQTRIDGRTSVALRYACQSWHNHLARSRGDTTDAISRLRTFLEKKFLAWLEVLSVLKATRVAIVTLEKLMVWLQEHSRDEQLLDMARECFYFVTGFFEPINVSATHIYHSALELSPLSSVIRKLYYHQRLPAFPRAEVGIPDSQESGITIVNHSRKSYTFTWSPCDQYVAIPGADSVKIHDALTFEPVSILRAPGKVLDSKAPSYSPDGHFLACITTTDITIWDIQTGGVAQQIKCNLGRIWSLEWSSDGERLGVLSNGNINVYDFASGRVLSSSRVDNAYLRFWAYQKSFRVMAIMAGENIDIFEVGPSLTKIESFILQLEERKDLNLESFSLTTYRISGLLAKKTLLILDIRNSARLLLADGFLWGHSFSSDGALFAARRDHRIHIWNYDGGCYIPWVQFSVPYLAIQTQFSPTLSSIVVQDHWTLTIRRLDSLRVSKAPATHRPHLDIFSRSGTHIATADYQEGTIMITNLLSPTPSQFIDTGDDITGLGLTGNLLLVKGRGVIGAWLLTEEGRVSNVLDNRRVDQHDKIWAISVPPRSHLKFSVEGDVGVIKCGQTLHVYNATTGEVFDSAQDLPHFSGSWYSFNDNLQAQHHRGNNSMQNASPKYKWKRSDTTWSWNDGWLKDVDGKRLLWLPVEWRVDWRRKVEWFPAVSTLKFRSRGDKVIIMIKLQIVWSALVSCVQVMLPWMPTSMNDCGIPSVDENNPLYCPEFPKSRYLKVVNRYLTRRRGPWRGPKNLVGQREPVKQHSLLLLSDSSMRSTSSERILGEFLSGNNWFSRPIDGVDNLPPYSFTDPSWSPSLRRGPNFNPLEAAANYAQASNYGARLKRKSSETFSDLFAPPEYAQSIPSAHDSSFDVEVRREELRFFGIPSSPRDPAGGINRHPPNDVDYLVHQLAIALPGIRLEERLRALNLLTPQIIMNFLVDNGHLNICTLDLLRLSDVDRIMFPRSFFNHENGLNLRGNEMYSVFGKPDAFRTLTRLSFSGTRLLASDIIHFHHLPKLSILLMDETGITNEAVFLLVPLKATLFRLSVSMNPGIDNEAVPAILILHRLSFLSIQDTGIDMAGLRKIAEVVDQEKRVIRIRLPFRCENYIKNVDSKYLAELKPPLIVHENHCSQLSIDALRRNLKAHAACNPDILTSGTRLEMVHRLTELLKIRRLDKLVIDSLWRSD